MVGEVLFDQFPDGQRVLGGAPFNVAWNLRGLGADPIFVSAVGDDDDGCHVADQMRNWGMDVDQLHVQKSAPTGRVTIRFENGEPVYDIVDNQAYDLLELSKASLGEATQAPMLYHGSLACRHQRARNSILAFRQSTNVPVFVDLNIRDQWFDMTWARPLLQDIRWLKVNQDELQRVSGRILEPESDIADAAGQVQARYGCLAVLVTRNERGACVVDESGMFHSADAGSLKGTFVDSVGAGDAFTAAAMLGLWLDLEWQSLLKFAGRFAASVCQLRGATTSDPAFYSRVPIPGRQ